MKRLLREPLVHFLLIGIALFVVYGKVAAPLKADSRIVVSAALIDEMTRDFEARWTRLPSHQELSGLVDTYVHDEILYREGIALGLDRDDALIKRRIRQKFEVMAEEQVAHDAPSDADLTTYITENAARFQLPARVTFQQIFFGEAGVATDIALARAAVARGTEPKKLGQVSPLPTQVENTAQDLVVRDFGVEFARQLETAPLGQWIGPVASSFGTHLVRVTARTPAELPSLAAVRPLVEREWENERRTYALDVTYRRLRASYDVVVPALPGAPARPVAIR